MSSEQYARAIFLFCTAYVGACGAPVVKDVPVAGPPVALASTPAMVVPGEQMTFSVSLAGIEGGEAVIASGQPGVMDGRRVVVMRSRVETSGLAKAIKEVRDDVTTWIDASSGHPVYQRAQLKFGAREAEMETKFQEGLSGSLRFSYQRAGRRVRTIRQRVPATDTVLDGHSLIGVLRGWDPRPGEESYFHVLAGKRLWQKALVFI